MVALEIFVGGLALLAWPALYYVLYTTQNYVAMVALTMRTLARLLYMLCAVGGVCAIQSDILWAIQNQFTNQWIGLAVQLMTFRQHAPLDWMQFLVAGSVLTVSGPFIRRQHETANALVEWGVLVCVVPFNWVIEHYSRRIVWHHQQLWAPIIMGTLGVVPLVIVSSDYTVSLWHISVVFCIMIVFMNKQRELDRRCSVAQSETYAMERDPNEETSLPNSSSDSSNGTDMYYRMALARYFQRPSVVRGEITEESTPILVTDDTLQEDAEFGDAEP